MSLQAKRVRIRRERRRTIRETVRAEVLALVTAWVRPMAPIGVHAKALGYAMKVVADQHNKSVEWVRQATYYPDGRPPQVSKNSPLTKSA